MEVKIPTSEELRVMRDAEKSLDLGEQVVHSHLVRYFAQLESLLKFETRTAPENREAVLTLLRAETRAQIEEVSLSWGQGVDLLIAIEDVEKVGVDPESYALRDICSVLTELFHNLRGKKIAHEDAVRIIKETVRRSKGLITPQETRSGKIWGFLSMIGSMFPEVVNEALGKNVFTSTAQE